jgi:hypothetical protein
MLNNIKVKKMIQKQPLLKEIIKPSFIQCK